MSEVSKESNVDVDELRGGFRVDVKPGFRGLAMTPTWVAQLLEPHERRWRSRGKAIMNDDGPIAAISDLLSLLDCGTLP